MKLGRFIAYDGILSQSGKPEERISTRMNQFIGHYLGFQRACLNQD